MNPTGRQLEIAGGGYAATVTEVGAGLRTVSHGGRPLVRGYDAEELMPVCSGAVLAPWPNRIGAGRYDFDGTTQQLPLNEPDRGTALHGLVAWRPWVPAEQTATSVVLTHRIWPQPGYPHLLDLRITYSVGEGGLTVHLEARNDGESRAPYGASVHPYLVAGPGPVDDWSLQVPAASYLEVDPERMLPVAVRPVEGTAYDFREPRRIGDVFTDNAFTDVAFDDAGFARARVLAAEGTGVEVLWERACPWVQVHTADRPEPELHRTGLALEPMTCPPDAFRSGTDLVVLEPGEWHEVSWTIRAAG